MAPLCQRVRVDTLPLRNAQKFTNPQVKVFRCPTNRAESVGGEELRERTGSIPRANDPPEAPIKIDSGAIHVSYKRRPPSEDLGAFRALPAPRCVARPGPARGKTGKNVERAGERFV